jgi:hypothetical protein
MIFIHDTSQIDHELQQIPHRWNTFVLVTLRDISSKLREDQNGAFDISSEMIKEWNKFNEYTVLQTSVFLTWIFVHSTLAFEYDNILGLFNHTFSVAYDV